MIPLIATTDIIRTTTSSAATVDIVLHYVEAVSASGAWGGTGRAVAALSSATSHDTLAGPGGSNFRTLKTGTWRNKDASLSVNITVMYRITGPVDYELYKCTLAPGDSLEYIEGIGFYVLKASPSSIIIGNANTADLTANAADTYLTGSSLALGAIGQAGLILRWRFTATKSAAGTATPIWNIRVGTAAGTGDTSRGTFTGVAQTAATDTGWFEIEAIIRAFSSSCVIQSAMRMAHKNATTGMANVAQDQLFQQTSASFDITPGGTVIGVSCNPGTSGVWTFQSISVAALNYKMP